MKDHVSQIDTEAASDPYSPHSDGDTLNIAQPQRVRGETQARIKADRAGFWRKIELTVRGMTESVVLSGHRHVILGRADAHSGFSPDVDLSPYGAYARGVSREHAHLLLYRGRPYIADVESDNGTFVGRRRLNPYEPEPLLDGDKIVLGRLVIDVRLK